MISHLSLSSIMKLTDGYRDPKVRKSKMTCEKSEKGRKMSHIELHDIVCGPVKIWTC